MSPEAVALVGGLLFLLIAIVGGGFSAKEVMIPGVPRWARIASLALGLALVVPYFSQALRSDKTRSPETGSPASIKLSSASASPSASISSSSSPSPSPEGVIHDARNRHDVSPDGLEVSGLIGTSAKSHPVVGDSIEVEFTLRNVGSTAVKLDETFVGVRTPDNENGDFGNSSERAVLKPHQALTINGSRVFDAAGVWKIFPCYALAARGEPKYCPDEWRAFQVLVGD
jgi:hypothetical protein